MYRRLAIKHCIQRLYQLALFIFAGSLIPIAGIMLAPNQIPPHARGKFILAFAIVGGILIFSLGLYEDVRIFSTLYRVSNKSKKFFAGKQTSLVNHHIQRSEDSARQIRLTRDDAEFFEHCHFEIIDPIRLLTLENYVYGKPGRINDSIWRYINRSNVLRQIVFLEASKASNQVSHISCKWSETAENAEMKLPPAYILLITEMHLGVYLFRFSDELYYAGDTWHQTVADAKNQAAYEYDVSDDAWQTVPGDVIDMIEYFSKQKRKLFSITDKIVAGNVSR
jgi:hypothetical protein